MRWRTIAFPQAPLEKYLSLYCELKISKSELQQAIGEDLHNVECKKAYCIKRSDVVNAIQLYKNGAISKDALVEWVNVVWFTELYVFDDEDADTETCTESYYQSPQYADCTVEKCHKFVLL